MEENRGTIVNRDAQYFSAGGSRITDPGAAASMIPSTRILIVHPKYEGISLSEDGSEIHCAPEYEQHALQWQRNPEWFKEMRALYKFLDDIQPDDT